MPERLLYGVPAWHAPPGQDALPGCGDLAEPEPTRERKDPRALRLTITSEQGPSLGETASIVFGVGGGSIGRAHDNDWILPDPQRFVSAHHARVHFRNGQYLLEDCSTNGVYRHSSTLGFALSASTRNF